ncbi:hypothetical protein Syun_013934 [Stephania yunnanensis]|uniref:Glycolipid transfer protein domain-containing protein n=1 Tax=Stephania yunnanensis TaxID=152371 RepID=A0AAP0P940_9MAGN
MKRRRADMEQKVCSEIRVAIEEVSKICKFNTRSDDSTSTSQQQQSEGGDIVNGGKNCYIAAQPFFNLCNLLIQVLDKIGPSMAVLRQDVHQNIQRLEKLCELDPAIYSNLVEVLKERTKGGKGKR